MRVCPGVVAVAWMILSGLIGLGLPLTLTAQTIPPVTALDVQLLRWERALEAVQRYLQGPEQNAERSREYQEQVAKIRAEAWAAKGEAENDLRAVQRLLEALGPVPEEQAWPESEEIANERHALNERLLDAQARIGLAELMVAQADELSQAILRLSRKAAQRQFLIRYPSILDLDTFSAAWPELLQIVTILAAAPFAWIEEQPRERSRWFWVGPLAVTVLVALVGWMLRFLLLTHFGRDPLIANPSYARRLGAAIAEGLARGIFPALIFVILIIMARQREAFVDSQFGLICIGLLTGAIPFILATAMARAVLAPELPAWRLLELTPRNARTVNRCIALLAAVVAIDFFIIVALDSFSAFSAAVTSVVAFPLIGLTVLGILKLSSSRLWQLQPASSAAPPGAADGNVEADREGVPAKPRGNRLWALVRGLAVTMTVAGLIAMVLGYYWIAEYFLNNLVFTGMIVGFLFLVRGLLAEVLGVAMPPSRQHQDGGAEGSTDVPSRQWYMPVVDTLLVLVGFLLSVPFWIRHFASLEDVLLWLRQGLSEFTIGSVTIAVTDILLSLTVLLIGVVLTRTLRRLLLQQVLPQTGLTSSVQHSIGVGILYVGIVLAVAFSIAALGLEFTHLALVAGALSVGIGFGLEGVVNNFVSGVILLFERPIKVGDWVVVGSEQGFVKRINIRATELETFEKSSVIVPNADLLANTVMNWTHKDQYGRVDVRVGVAYDADVDRVREILLDCAHRHPLVLKRNEALRAFVLFQDFGRNRLEFELRCYTGIVTERIFIASDLRFEIERRFQEAGIKIPLPQEVIHLGAESRRRWSLPPPAAEL